MISHDLSLLRGCSRMLKNMVMLAWSPAPAGISFRYPTPREDTVQRCLTLRREAIPTYSYFVGSLQGNYKKLSYGRSHTLALYSGAYIGDGEVYSCTVSSDEYVIKRN